MWTVFAGKTLSFQWLLEWTIHHLDHFSYRTLLHFCPFHLSLNEEEDFWVENKNLVKSQRSCTTLSFKNQEWTCMDMAMALAIEIPFLQLRNIKLCKQLTPRAKWPNIPFCIWDNQNPWPYFGEFSLFAQLFWILWYFSVRNGLVQQKILKARVISGYGNTAFLLSGEFDMLFIKKKDQH